MAPGGNTTLAVRFQPTTGGNRTAAVSFTEDDPTQPSPFTFVVSGTGIGPSIAVKGGGQPIVDGATTPSAANDTAFGSALVGATPAVSQTYTITNNGAGNLILGGVSFGGANPNDFSVSSQPASPVAPGGSTSFTVQFQPQAAGSRSATVTFGDNDNTQPSPFTFAIGGVALAQAFAVTGKGQPIANFATTTSTSNATDFGTIILGTPITATFTIINSGGSALTLGSVSVSGGNSGDYSITAQPSPSVAAGSSTTFTVQVRRLRRACA